MILESALGIGTTVKVQLPFAALNCRRQGACPGVAPPENLRGPLFAD